MTRSHASPDFLFSSGAYQRHWHVDCTEPEITLRLWLSQSQLKDCHSGQARPAFFPVRETCGDLHPGLREPGNWGLCSLMI